MVVETVIKDIVDCLVKCLSSSKKVLVFGVGGNAANAMHMAAELSGKYEEYEECYPCFCLVDNPCEITAITNDFGWDRYFEKQVRGKASEGDAVVVFSISGNGKYLENGLLACRDKKCLSVWICGQSKESLAKLCTHVLSYDSLDTPRVQERQCELLHYICGEVKRSLKTLDWNT